MPEFAAVMWKVKPGSEEELAELFANSKRPDSFTLTDEHGNQVGQLLSTTVFFKDDTVVRVAQYDGELSAVMRHMAAQPAIHELEEALKKYLVEHRETDTPEAFRAFFLRSSMRRLLQRFANDDGG